MCTLREFITSMVQRHSAFSFMKKTFMGCCVLFLSTLGFLSACHNDSPQPAPVFDKPLYSWGKVRGQTITVRGNKDDLRRPYMRKSFQRYHELTGNTVILEEFSHQEMGRNMPAAFVEHSVEKPDLVLSPGGASITNLNPNENFYDFTHAPWVDDLTDTAINQTIYDAKVIGLPFWEASVSGILYNKDLFKKLAIAVPRTQAEFLAACETLRQHSITPVYLPFAESSMMLYQFPLDYVVSHGNTLDKLNSGALAYADIPEIKTLVAWYKTMADKGYFGHTYHTNDWAGMNEALRSQKYAMMICWDTWLYTDFTGDPSQFGIMPAFMGVPENGSFEGPNLMLLMVNKQSPRLEVALDLITFMADPYNYNVAMAGIYTAPVFKNQIGSLSTPQYVESERAIEKLFYDSTAWLRIKGFSQLDASYIQMHMRDPSYTIDQCLQDMDAARLARMAKETDKPISSL